MNSPQDKATLVERLRVQFDSWTMDPTFDTRQEAATHIERIEAERDALQSAAATFLAKLDLCQPYIDNAFVMMAIRGMEHTGPTYGEELSALRQALADTGGGDADAAILQG